MAYERSESAQENFGKYIQQFPPETKTLIRKGVNFYFYIIKRWIKILFRKWCYIHTEVREREREREKIIYAGGNNFYFETIFEDSQMFTEMFKALMNVKRSTKIWEYCTG